MIAANSDAVFGEDPADHPDLCGRIRYLCRICEEECNAVAVNGLTTASWLEPASNAATALA
jgi:hypothetical protein